MKKIAILAGLLLALTCTAPGWASGAENFSDTTRSYTLPLFTALANGQVGLSWSETDADGINYLYWAVSKDQGKSFSEKQLVHASRGLRNAKLMRAKVLAKKDGSLVAVFGLSPQPAESSASAHSSHAGRIHAGHSSEASAKPARGGRPSDLQIVYMVSKDLGATWTAPATVHQDKTPNIIRGFFDSIVMANDEVAVAFLKDTGNPHERDLRLITSTKGVFGEERMLEKQSCDCCNISLLVDAKGALNIYYRSNINNVRDIAKMVSTDHGKTFSKPEVILADKWEINGCPHSGPVSTVGKGTNLISWYSAGPDQPGVRLATQEGKRLTVLSQSATNPFLVATKKAPVLVWEERAAAGTGAESAIVYQLIPGQAPVKPDAFTKVGQGSNPVGISVGNELWIASEVLGNGTKKSIQLVHVAI
ncbi:hypothetical protein GCM10027275_50910 [Rhabdobacter roseus]|uniref:Sialidase domain-containing protein n=1 Tax=Rhabdobacter roseus TaxID=1655419 RepID=A0A840TV88_9BACT|nr:sialidase family protein [Rhabdobacter roseus]MBB5287164.1 hypothetical protein [Rhabdobacter roseus]